MTDREIRRESLWGLSHYTYGEAYFGSCRGMRFRVAREPLKNVSRNTPEEQAQGNLKASVWPEPFAYAKADPDTVTDRLFPFSEEGMEQVCAFLNEQAARFR